MLTHLFYKLLYINNLTRYFLENRLSCVNTWKVEAGNPAFDYLILVLDS